MISPNAIQEKIRVWLELEGLELLGFLKLSGDTTSFSRFQQWLSEGKNAGMTYMENHQHLREHPQRLEPGLEYSALFGVPYYQGDRYSADGPRIAQYARMEDYHKFMARRAKRVLAKLTEEYAIGGRVTVDTAPILERDLAVRSGKGFIGKNTCYIDSRKGSFFLLGAIHMMGPALDLSCQPNSAINPDTRSQDGGCGTCRRCQVYCPTGALNTDYVLDANKCLSYWTIEHRGTIPRIFWKGVGRYWFGCDICQVVCPYNRKIDIATSLPLKKNLANLDLLQVSTMDQSFYEETFGGSPMTRAKKFGLQRNALIAMYINGDPRVQSAIKRLKSLGQDLHPVLADTIQQMDQEEIDTCAT